MTLWKRGETRKPQRWMRKKEEVERKTLKNLRRMNWKKLTREEIGGLVSKMLLTQSKMRPRTSQMVYSKCVPLNKCSKIRKDKDKVIIAEWKKDTTRRTERKVLERDSEGEREQMNKKHEKE